MVAIRRETETVGQLDDRCRTGILNRRAGRLSDQQGDQEECAARHSGKVAQGIVRRNVDI